MADLGGLSFNPSGENGSNLLANKPENAPTQNAIRVLSLRVPRFSGGSGLAPQGLLQSPSHVGQPQSALAQLVQQLSGGMGQPSGMPQQGGGDFMQAVMQLAGMMPQGGGGMTPHVTPGVVPGESRPDLPPVQMEAHHAPSPLTPIGSGWNANPAHSDFQPQGGGTPPPVTPFRQMGPGGFRF